MVVVVSGPSSDPSVVLGGAVVVVVVVDGSVVSAGSVWSTTWEGIEGKIVSVPLSARSVALATMMVVSARPPSVAVPPPQYQVLVKASSGALTGRKPWASSGVMASTASDWSRSWSWSTTQAPTTRPARMTTAGQRENFTRGPPYVGPVGPVAGPGR